MPRRRSRARNGLEYAAVRIALGSLAVAPPALANRLARFYAGALDRAVPRLRRIALRNLQFSFPALSFIARQRLVDGIFSSIGRILLSFARFPKIDRTNVDGWIRCEGLGHVEAALARGRGVLFATGHLGNWELSAFAFALLKRPMYVVVRPLDNPLIDRLVTRYRGLSGNRSISKRDGARDIFRALANNELVGILADQHTHDGLSVEFFGRPALASAGLAKIAHRTGAAVIPGFALWSDRERKYMLRFLPAVAITGDANADTQRIQSAIEEVIREYPDQWLWIHRRWRD